MFLVQQNFTPSILNKLVHCR